MPAKSVLLQVRCSHAEKQMFEQAADRDGLDFSKWARALMTDRANEVLQDAADEPAAAFLPGFGLTKET